MQTEELELAGPAAPRVIGIGAKPNILLRAFAYVVAVASTIAVLVVAVLSIGFYAVVMPLGKVPPLRDTYQFFSRAYDGILAHLGQKILRDPRDIPALRLMVSLTLTVIPICVAQLILGKLSFYLVVAFYLSLYGPKFQRFVRIFSAKHLEAHRRQGYFSEKYDKLFGRYIEFFLGYFYGNVPELDRTVHVRLHHKENSGPDDTICTIGFDRTSRLDFLSFLADNTWTVLGIAPCAYFKSRGDDKYLKLMLWGIARYFIFFAAVFLYDWRIGIFYALVPLLSMNFIMAATAWVQHAFYDPEHPGDYFANTVTVMDEWNFMNEGYHLAHHHRSSLHWTDMPAHFEQLRAKMKDSGSLVFRDLDFYELFFELTLLGRLDVLAEKLVTWEPMRHEEKVALLAKRTKPATVSPAEAALPVTPVSTPS
jgi:fatty acid desaturase